MGQGGGGVGSSDGPGVLKSLGGTLGVCSRGAMEESLGCSGGSAGVHGVLGMCSRHSLGCSVGAEDALEVP